MFDVLVEAVTGALKTRTWLKAVLAFALVAVAVAVAATLLA